MRRPRRLAIACVLALAALPWPGSCRADASIPWMPSERARHALELLADEAELDLTLTQWPLPGAAVAAALDKLPARLPMALEQARSQVRSELRASESAGATAIARNPGESLAGFGDDAVPGSALGVTSDAYAQRWAAGRLGLRVERATSGGHAPAVRFEGTALAFEALGVELQAWSHRSWWGPGWQSSLILGNNAAPVNAVGLQRATASRSASPWLSWMGPWTYEFFVGRLEGGSMPAHPALIGNRLTLKPLSWLEIGLTRTAQWGGHDRPQTPSSFVDAVLGSKLNNAADHLDSDPANELAGFDFRARCPAGLHCAAYAQLIGEDQAGLLPSHYLGLYGFETWSSGGSERWIVEYAETGCRTPVGRPPLKGCAYRNSVYADGYTQDGRWLGSSAGPDSRLLTLGWTRAASESSLRLHYGLIGSRVGSFSSAVDDRTTAGHVLAASGKQVYHWRGVSLEPELGVVRIAAAAGVRYERRLGLVLRTALGQ